MAAADRKPPADHVALIQRSLFTLLLATAGGFVCNLLHLPLAWMIGSMIITSIAAFVRLPVLNLHFLRPPLRAIVGCMLGASITPEAAGRMLQWPVPISGLFAATIIGAFLGWLVLRKLGRLDASTAYFGAMPGGFFEMLMLGEARGANVATVGLLHTVRVFVIILTMPFILMTLIGIGEMPAPTASQPPVAVTPETALWFLACAVGGFYIGKLLRLPSYSMFGPLLLSAAAHFFGLTDFRLPGEVVIGVQIILGIGIGMRFLGLTLRDLAKVAVFAFAMVTVHLTVAAGMAFAVFRITGIEYVLLLLAYAPAGLVEMSLVTLALGRDAVFVAAHHLLRILTVLLASPTIFSLMQRRTPPPDQDGP